MTKQKYTVAELDALAQKYSAARAIVAERVNALEDDLRQLNRRRLPGIKNAAADAETLQAELRAAIELNPEHFEKPRTMTLHGIKFGFQKGKGKLVWDDAAKVIAAIRRCFSGDKQRSLIAVVETPAKEALELLPAKELNALGVRIDGAGDKVVVKATDSEIDKLVTKLLAEGAKDIEEAA